MATYKFKKPWDFGGETISEVEIKENFTGADAIALRNIPVENRGDIESKMIQIGTGWPKAQVEKIPFNEWDDLAIAVLNFMQGGKTNSEK